MLATLGIIFIVYGALVVLITAFFLVAAKIHDRRLKRLFGEPTVDTTDWAGFRADMEEIRRLPEGIDNLPYRRQA